MGQIAYRDVQIEAATMRQRWRPDTQAMKTVRERKAIDRACLSALIERMRKSPNDPRPEKGIEAAVPWRLRTRVSDPHLAATNNYFYSRGRNARIMPRGGDGGRTSHSEGRTGPPRSRPREYPWLVGAETRGKTFHRGALAGRADAQNDR